MASNLEPMPANPDPTSVNPDVTPANPDLTASNLELTPASVEPVSSRRSSRVAVPSVRPGVSLSGTYFQVMSENDRK